MPGRIKIEENEFKYADDPQTMLPLFVALSAPSAAAERSLEKVRIAVSSKSLGFLDTWAAKERGFYRKHGIEAEIIAMRPPLTIGALQSGDIDYAFGASTISRGSISGAPVRLVTLALRTSFHHWSPGRNSSPPPTRKERPSLSPSALLTTSSRAIFAPCRSDPREVNSSTWADRIRALQHCIQTALTQRRFPCPFSSSPNAKI
jgi:hypothetical protein